MISYLSGEIILKKENFIILSVNGIGYKIFLSQKTIEKISEKTQNLKIFCYLNVRENLLALYGFLTYEELELFNLLEEISGIGPKAALKIASIGSVEEFKKAILSQNEKFFDNISGIGKKKIQKIILELTGKIKEVSKEKTTEIDNAQEALIGLGFSKEKAKQALSKISQDIQDTNERVKQALSILGKG